MTGLPLEVLPAQDQEFIGGMIERFEAKIESVTLANGRTIETVFAPSSSYSIPLEWVWRHLSNEYKKILLRDVGAPGELIPRLAEMEFTDYKEHSQLKIFAVVCDVVQTWKEKR